MATMPEQEEKFLISEIDVNRFKRYLKLDDFLSSFHMNINKLIFRRFYLDFLQL